MIKDDKSVTNVEIVWQMTKKCDKGWYSHIIVCQK